MTGIGTLLGLTARSLAVVAGLTAIAATSQAAIIADLTSDYTPVNFPTGWSYSRNTGTIGNSANYVDLLWDAGNSIYDVTGAGFPAAGFNYTFEGAGSSHPGRGTGQGSAFDGYLILGYTIQAGEAGSVSLVNGSITGNDPNGAGGASNGWDIRIYVGNTQQGATSVFPWSNSAAAFSQSLGSLNTGDTVYVALGANGVDDFDNALLSFQLDSTRTAPVPEPQTVSFIGFGLIAAVGLRRYVR